MVSNVQNLGLQELSELKQSSSPQKTVARMPHSPQDKVAFGRNKEETGEKSNTKRNVIIGAALAAGAYIGTAAITAKKGKFLQNLSPKKLYNNLKDIFTNPNRSILKNKENYRHMWE